MTALSFAEGQTPSAGKAGGFFTRAGKFLARYWGQILLHLLLIFLLILVLYPLLLLLMKSFKSNSQEQSDPFGFPAPFLFENYSVAWSNVGGSMLNSFIVTVGTTLGSVFVAAITAYAFVRFNFPFKETIFMTILALMMVPGMLTLISQYQLANALNLVDNYLGVILPGVAGSLPFSVFLLRTFFKGIPKDLFEAADIDGAGDVTMFFVIMLPLSRAIVATLVINQFLATWNDYLWPSLILLDESMRTIPITLVSWTKDYALNTGGYGPPFAAYVLTSIPLILLFAAASKQFIAGLTSGAFKM